MSNIELDDNYSLEGEASTAKYGRFNKDLLYEAISFMEAQIERCSSTV